ncbi:MAG: DNA polymerase IV, partial [Angustibacter sp.]
MRRRAEILHLDLDAFFAAVEQRDKPSLRGRPVIVGGQGGRSVVAAASYEARAFGVRSAMPTGQARQLCPHAAILAPRFIAYQAASRVVMRQIGEFSSLVEQVSIDEAYADLAVRPGDRRPGDAHDSPVSQARRLRERVYARTGLRASIGLAPSKSLAKLASEAAKPDGLRVIFPRQALEFLWGLSARALPGVGPATGARLAAIGVHSVRELAELTEAEAERVLGVAHGRTLLMLARGVDRRPIVPHREVKSISVESTFAQDLVERFRVELELDRLAGRLADRLARAGAAGHTITVKIRYADFSLRTRSASPKGSVTQVHEIAAQARRIVAELDPQGYAKAGGIRLLGIAISGLAEWVQADLWGPRDGVTEGDKDHPSDPAAGVRDTPALSPAG